MRRLLLDTHTFLWWLQNNPRLGVRARELITESRNDIYVSAVSLREISIKKSLGKLQAPDGLDSTVENEGFAPFPISLFHAERAGALAPLHCDPFDRMLVAQSQAEGLEILSADSELARYGAKVVNAAE